MTQSPFKSSSRQQRALMVGSAPMRVMIVDDHRLMREGIVRILSFQPDIHVVAEAATGEEALQQFSSMETRCDLETY